ncbi:MAG: cobalamin B12-binding domain-containing protein, partial [Candidatus Omnitrophica bacterium]|nr:cobalamin B12-binding domain-containing protein [Candidatus Omnitrophota bacterium]
MRSKDIFVYIKRPYNVMAMAITVWSFLFKLLVNILTWAIKSRAMLSHRSIVSGFSLGLCYMKKRYNLWFKVVAISIVCLFLFNNFAWSYSAKIAPVRKSTLSRWLLTKALADEGVIDPSEVMLEAVTGIQFIAAGRSTRVANSILIENYAHAEGERKIKFLESEKVKRENGITKARFRIIGEDREVFEISYQNHVIDITKVESPGGLTGNVSSEDFQPVFRSLHEALPGDPVSPKKIVLVNIVDDAVSSLDFPVGLYALKSYLEHNYAGRCEVEIKDLQLENIEDVAGFIKRWTPHVVGLSLMLGSDKRADDFMRILQSRLNQKNKPVLVVGKNIPTSNTSKTLKRFSRAICVTGEGELAMGGILEYV